MDFKKILYNIFQDINSKLRVHFITIISVFIITIFIILFMLDAYPLVNNNMLNNIINVSGALAGFLFTTFGIILSFPDNKLFIQGLKKYGYLTRIYTCIFIGILGFILTTVLGVLNVLTFLILPLFIMSLSYTIISAMFLFLVSLYISK